MKKLTSTILLILIAVCLYGQTPCQNGFAGTYPCKDYDLMSHISPADMGASEGNDSWGWTDPQSGKEYALICLNNGTAFIDISNPTSPVYLGKLPTATVNSDWRDVKVYKNHAFIVSEASNHGMQVFDLTRLRNVASPPQTFTADKRYTEFGNAHNIVINEDSGYAYIVGALRSGTYKGGPLFVNIQDPVNPINEGGFLSSGGDPYTHDAQVITYNGPDTDYTGKEILIGSNQLEVVIADITDKNNPRLISTIKYTNVGYTHQGWFTENLRYFILGDEFDESNVGFNTRTIVFDFQDLDNPQQHMIYNGPTPAIDHNGYVKGDKFYLANYRAGIRVVDIANIGSKTMTEVGYFDTSPANDNASFAGAWNVYPYFNSGNIVISDINSGFFLVKKSGSNNSCVATTPTGVNSSNVTNNSATINWTAVSNASYDVRYRQTGTTSWTTNSVSTATYAITNLSANTQYEAQVRSKCSDGTTSDYSNSVSFTTNTVQITYCSSNGQTITDEYISNVSLGTINNTTTASSGGYGDYTSITTDLAQGSSQTITITPTWTGNTYNEAYSVWIDYNQDGDFTDAGEQVWSNAPSQTTPVSGNFTIPNSAPEGATRMRVSMKYNGIPTSCESFQYGEVEDYSVNITKDGIVVTGCTSGISSFPYNEGFENTLGNWTQSTSDDIDWTINSSGTPSQNTGPSSATQGTYYLYVEASVNGTGYPNKQAILNSPCFDLSNESFAMISFGYHMYGNTDMGSFILEISTDDGTTWSNIWSQTGNQGNSWKTANVDLSSYIGSSIQLRFNRTTGATWQADIAIDNVVLTNDASQKDKLNQEADITFMVYPNPAKNILNILLDGIKKETDFEIKNMLGQQVSKGKMTNTIDVSSLREGTYFLQIVANNKVYTKPFLKN